MRLIQATFLLLFLAAVGLAPALYGGNFPLAWGIDAFIFGTLLSLYSAALLVARRPFPVPARRLAVPLVAAVIVIGWCLLQTQSWVPAVFHDPAWRLAAEALERPLDGAMSVNPGQTLLSTTRLVTACTCFFLAVQLARDPRNARQMVFGIAIVVAIHAVVALVANALKIGLLPGIPRSSLPVGFKNQLAGTFINQNHFAIMIGLGAIAAWSLFERSLRNTLSDHGFGGGKEVIARTLYACLVVALFAVLFMPIWTAILLSGSRAGFFGTGLAILVMIGLASKGSLRFGKLTTALIVLLAIGGAVAAVMVVGGRLAGEMAQSSSSDLTTRLNVGSITLSAIADRPLKGFGFGTFSDFFQVYRDGRVSWKWRWEEAHNSYLEALGGLGIPIALVLLGGIAWIVVQCLRGAWGRRREQFAPIAAVGASILVGLHVLIDFSIQIEGVTLVYAALLGTGYAQSWSSRES